MSKPKHITLPHEIDIYLDGKGNGSISSQLKSYILKFVREINSDKTITVVEPLTAALETMVLTHAKHGMNITSQRYLKGLEAAILKLAALI